MASDVAVIATFLISFQLVDRCVPPLLLPKLIPHFQSLPPPIRYSSSRRLLNLLIQIISLPISLYFLFLPLPDPLYSYPPYSHTYFLFLLSFYLHDASVLILHPYPHKNSLGWVVHHYVAVILLLVVIQRRCSTLPAVTFLISAAGHIGNDMRFFLSVRGPVSVKVRNFLNVSTFVVFFVASILPPPHLLLKASNHLQVSLLHLLTHRMRVYCQFSSLLIYIPHLIIAFVLLRRILVNWNNPPSPYKYKVT